MGCISSSDAPPNTQDETLNQQQLQEKQVDNDAEAHKAEEKAEDGAEEGYWCFGFGSNMSRSNMVEVKGLNPIAMYRGIVDDFKVIFNYGDPDGESNQGMGNVEVCEGFQCHGIVTKLNKKDMDAMRGVEVGYDCRIVKASIYPQDIDKYNLPKEPIDVQLFIVDENTKPTAGSKFCAVKTRVLYPSRNYLDTLISGAREMELDSDYITMLEKEECVPLNKFEPSEEQWVTINAKTFTMKDIEDKEKCLYVTKGIVLDASESPMRTIPIAKSWFGNDRTFEFVAKRWAFYKENADNLKSIDDIANFPALCDYCNDQVAGSINPSFGIKVAGKLADTEKYSLESYDW